MSADKAAPITIETDWDVEYKAVMDGVPDPPKSIRTALERDHKVWRWLAKGHIQRHSMRGYTAYSATSEDKKAAERDGRFRVDVENKFCWGEDAFLGVIGRQQYENRAAAKRRMSQEQTALSKDGRPLQEQARRIGSDAKITVSGHMSGSLDDGLANG